MQGSANPPLETLATFDTISDQQEEGATTVVEINESSTRSTGTLLQTKDFCSRLRVSSKQHKKSFILAMVLFFIGTVLLGIGIHCLVACTPERHGVIFLVSGLLAFLPGSYGVLVFVQHARRIRGYDPCHLERKWHGV
eukprot:TRINITY_DN7571_c0_g1_i1.p1 TRINITY_DN7571_c0_g1~~TRINITY_DN7571_c0_g1_i1.p1  ORF type:complete len:156 (+),score=16.43 TRINITY_DN7571_c0_g1_i1:57-470(+)